MPAVDPTRLRFQIEALMKHFQSPPNFHRHLRNLFSLYANRALRSGDTTALKPLEPRYQLPQPVLRQLELDLQPHIKADPQSALELADELWQDNYFEIQQTAIIILNLVPANSSEPILERLNKWLTPGLDKTLTSFLLSAGTRVLQLSFPDSWETFIETLLRSNDRKTIAQGIQGLTEGMKRTAFKNLPAVFRLVSPFIRNPDSAYRRELEALVQALADRWPTETAYFLKQALSISESPETARLVKKTLSFFNDNLQEDLRAALRQSGSR